MKIKNNVTTGIIIGIGIIIVPLILMGTTNINAADEIGRYQISTTTHGDGSVYETIIDTKTGRVKSREAKPLHWYWTGIINWMRINYFKTNFQSHYLT